MKSMKLFLSLILISFLSGSYVFAVSVQDVVNNVSQSTYTYYMTDLLYTHLGDNRGFGAQHDLAQANIYSAFQSYGLTTTLDPFQYNSGTYYNVVGVQLGMTRPSDIYIIGAHYDSVNNPGADDNASGTAGVMEAARVLSQYDFEATLIYIAFDREEQGLIGSNAYAQAHSYDNILGMISMDMIAYDGSGSNNALIYGHPESDPIKYALAAAIAQYGNGLTATINGSLDASDHAPFEWQGFDACLLIENDVWSNPHYHQQSDSIDTPNYINYVYSTNMVRSTVGYLATVAVLIPEPGTIILIGLGFIGIIRKIRF